MKSFELSYKGYTELHTHLYGSLSAELLYDIGKKNPTPRWNLYTDFYEKNLSRKVETHDFFKIYDTVDKFKQIYYFEEKGQFLEFQAKFNLIIALVKFDPEEIRYVAREVVEEYYRKGVDYAEYRLMYSPFATEDDYREKTIAACLGLREGESRTGAKGRLVVSLHREKGYISQYNWLRKIMKESEIVSHYLVGIDFCNIEEGFPPKEKEFFFRNILEDNQANPSGALSILYHVGESFRDKSHLSACRWILEASEYGAHRLGHCIALGESIDKFKNSTKLESIQEYRESMQYIKNHYEEIQEFGELSSFSFFQRESEKKQNSNGDIGVVYSEEFIRNLSTFRKYVVQRLIENGTVVESCPTSNLRIGMIDDVSQLPIVNFSKTNLKLTIGADDPGIFSTDIPTEYKICSEGGVKEETLANIRKHSIQMVSEKLSGREGFAP